MTGSGRRFLSGTAPRVRSRYGGVDVADAAAADDADVLRAQRTPRTSVVGVVTRRVVTGLVACACVVAAVSRTMQGGDPMSAPMLGRALGMSGESGYELVESNPSPVSAGEYF